MQCRCDIEVHMRGLWINILDEFLLDLLDVVECFVEEDEVELPAWVERPQFFIRDLGCFSVRRVFPESQVHQIDLFLFGQSEVE